MKLAQELLRIREGVMDSIHDFQNMPDTKNADLADYQKAYGKYTPESGRIIHSVRTGTKTNKIHVLHGPRSGPTWDWKISTHEDGELKESVGLSDDQKRDLLAAFKQWSGGLSPDKVEKEKIQTFMDAEMSNDIPGPAARAFLHSFGSVDEAELQSWKWSGFKEVKNRGGDGPDAEDRQVEGIIKAASKAEALEMAQKKNPSVTNMRVEPASEDLDEDEQAAHPTKAGYVYDPEISDNITAGFTNDDGEQTYIKRSALPKDHPASKPGVAESTEKAYPKKPGDKLFLVKSKKKNQQTKVYAKDAMQARDRVAVHDGNHWFTGPQGTDVTVEVLEEGLKDVYKKKDGDKLFRVTTKRYKTFVDVYAKDEMQAVDRVAANDGGHAFTGPIGKDVTVEVLQEEYDRPAHSRSPDDPWVIYAPLHKDYYKMSQVRKQNKTTIYLWNGDTIGHMAVVSNNKADWDKYKDAKSGVTPKSVKEDADLAKQLVRGEKAPKGLMAKLDHWLMKLMIEKDGNRFLPAETAVKALKSYGFSDDQVHKIREAAAEAAQTAIARMQQKHGDRVPDKYLSKMGSSFAVFDLYLNVSEEIHKEFAALMRQLFDAKLDKMKDTLVITKESLDFIQGLLESENLRRVADEHDEHPGEDRATAEQCDIGDVVEVTGNVNFKGETGEITRFGKDKKFVVVKLHDGGEHSFHSSDVSASNTDFEDGKEVEHKKFYVVFYAKDEERSWIGLVSKEAGGKWHEKKHVGKPDYRWGHAYMSYLTPDDIVNDLRRYTSRSVDIEGPFYKDGEARDYVEQNWGTLTEAKTTGVAEGTVSDFAKGFKDKLLGKKKEPEATKKPEFKRGMYDEPRSGVSADSIRYGEMKRDMPGRFEARDCGDQPEAISAVTSEFKKKLLTQRKKKEEVKEETFTDFDDWKAAVLNSYPTQAKNIKFKGRMEGKKTTISAEIPGEDRSYGVWDQEEEKGKVLSEGNWNSSEEQEQRAMDNNKRSFKRAELEFELGHETRGDRRYTPKTTSAKYGIEIDGKLWKKAGVPVSFNSKETAERASKGGFLAQKNTKVVPL